MSIQHKLVKLPGLSQLYAVLSQSNTSSSLALIMHVLHQKYILPLFCLFVLKLL